MQAVEILLANLPITIYATPNENVNTGERVIVSTTNGLELGIVKNKVDTNEDLATIVRKATQEDITTNCENCKLSRSLLSEIKKEAQRLGLDMKIGFVCYNLDKTKLSINYTADDRVDFRELIKLLGSKCKTRIEMRQIGNRDETKMIGAMGICGRETCCKSFLSDFDKVSIKMAKNQNISLNPTRINGMCGRLLCCLKYEDEFYDEMQKKMPKVGFSVTTPDGKGTVTATDFLRETVTVSFTKDDTTEIKTYELKDIQKDKK